MNRRALLKALAVAPLPVVAGTPVAHAGTSRTTVVVTPHPDDETLRLTAVALNRARRGDRMILLAVTDGEASSVKTKLGWTADQLATQRRIEQMNAWSALTYGRGTIIRMGQPDGGVSESAVRTRLNSLLATTGYRTEVWAACEASDTHRDHVAVARAVASSTARYRRYGLPTGSTTGTLWTCPDRTAARQADLAYDTVGWLSVSSSFQKLRDSGYSSRTV